MQIDEHVVFRHQLLQCFHDIEKQVVHHIVVVLSRSIGQMACAEHDNCIVSARLEISAMGEYTFVRFNHLLKIT